MNFIHHIYLKTALVSELDARAIYQAFRQGNNLYLIYLFIIFQILKRQKYVTLVSELIEINKMKII